MGEIFNSLPEHIKEHLKAITENSGLPVNDESLEILSKNWIGKRDLFEDQIKTLDMLDLDSFSKDAPKGALMLTYSGSLISLGSQEGNNAKRWAEYYSIKLRGDVPDILKITDTRIAADTGVDKILEFESGPLKSTSAIFKIAVCKDGVALDEQETRIHEATIFLTNGFIKINRSLSINADIEQGQFTMKSIITQIAKRNDITQKQAKAILDDYLVILETGILLGEKVPLGKLGKLFLKMRPAQKARIGKNFSTGEEITIKAKPEMPVPKISFSHYLKERAAVIGLPAGSGGEEEDEE